MLKFVSALLLIPVVIISIGTSAFLPTRRTTMNFKSWPSAEPTCPAAGKSKDPTNDIKWLSLHREIDYDNFTASELEAGSVRLELNGQGAGQSVILSHQDGSATQLGMVTTTVDDCKNGIGILYTGKLSPNLVFSKTETVVSACVQVAHGGAWTHKVKEDLGRIVRKKVLHAFIDSHASDIL